MNKIKTRQVGRAVATASEPSLQLGTEFSPNLNGTYHIRFRKENSSAGFKVLIKGGMFHRLPDGFVVTRKHMDLLKEENVPYEDIR